MDQNVCQVWKSCTGSESRACAPERLGPRNGRFGQMLTRPRLGRTQIRAPAVGIGRYMPPSTQALLHKSKNLLCSSELLALSLKL